MSARLFKQTDAAQLPALSLFRPAPAVGAGQATGTAPQRVVFPTVAEHAPESIATTHERFSANDPADLEAVGADAETMLDAARIEAEAILEEARARAASLEAESRQRGLVEGRASAAMEVAAAVEPVRSKLTQTLHELSELRPALAARAERELVRLALEIAKKVVQREVTTDPEIVLALSRVALGRLHSRAVATVRLNPEDYEYVNARLEQLEARGASIEVVADRSVGRGGCIVESEMGDVDVRVEQQFREIERGFLAQ